MAFRRERRVQSAVVAGQGGKIPVGESDQFGARPLFGYGENRAQLRVVNELGHITERCRRATDGPLGREQVLDLSDLAVFDFQPDCQEAGDLTHHDCGIDPDAAGHRIGERKRRAYFGGHDIPTTIRKGQLYVVLGKANVAREGRPCPVMLHVGRAILIADPGQAPIVTGAATPPHGWADRD